MKLLVLAEDYPSESNKYINKFIHTRNIEYSKNNIEVIVLSFRAKASYTFEGIMVLSPEDYEKKYNVLHFDKILSHAPNLKHHVVFLKKNRKKIKEVIFVIHGHEVLEITKYYPRPYKFDQQSSFLRTLIRKIYDKIKLKVIKSFTLSLLREKKVRYIFVSEWMENEFYKNVKVSKEKLKDFSTVIPNTIHQAYLSNSYNFNSSKKADVITIRPLDQSKYGIDIVCAIAEENPNLTFHIYGKGEYFKHNELPKNVTNIQEFYKAEELPKVLDQYKIALMPTRLDSQGVMMCEMATYGIPLITSNIPVCKEMLRGFNNIFYIENNLDKAPNINEFLNSINDVNKEKNKKFSLENTILREIEYIKRSHS